MSSEAPSRKDVPEDVRSDVLGVVLGILQDAGNDLDRFTHEELWRAVTLAYDASVQALGGVRPGFLQEERSKRIYERKKP
jgi:hypothetical protein